MLIYVHILHVRMETNTLFGLNQQMTNESTVAVIEQLKTFIKDIKKSLLDFLQTGVSHKILQYRYNFAE